MSMKNAITISSLDEYNRNARLKPAFLVIFPIGILISLLGLNVSVMLAALSGPLATVGLTFLLAQIGRDFGKRKEPYLYSLWTGKPSVSKMRHSDTSINVHTRERYHQRAVQLLRIPMPTEAGERDDPQCADQIYEAYSNLLLERTRDKKKFPLIFQELTNYGFRRNLWGMKPFGLTLSIVCVFSELVRLVSGLFAHRPPSVLNLASLLLATFLLLCWIFVINPEWVRIAANAYAERLLAASEMLDQSSVNPSTKSAPRKSRSKNIPIS
jgi:hypothetical protein